MQPMLAVIATPYLQEFIAYALEELHLDVSYQIFPYTSYREVPAVFASIPEAFAGVLVSGVFPATIIHKTFPDTKKTVAYFNSDNAGILRLFLRLFVEEPSLDLSRIHGDFVELFGIGLLDYLISDQRSTYNDLVDPIVERMSLEELFQVEERELERVQRLFREGQIDIAVMRSSTIVPQLQQEGLRVYFPYPSMDYLRAIVERLLQNIAIRRLEGSRPAVINVAIDLSDLKERGDALQLRCIALQEALVEFSGSSTLDYVLQQTHLGFEILTNRKTLEAHTRQFTACTLGDFLGQRLRFRTFIGYGVGDDLYQARLNAINAGREAGLGGGAGSFLIDEKGTLTGPLGQPGHLTVPAGTASPALQDVASAAGLSPLTVSRIVSAVKSMPEQRITAKDLAYKLSVTQRSANRFLRILLEAEAVVVVAEKRATTKGRPERVFQLSDRFFPEGAGGNR